MKKRKNVWLAEITRRHRFRRGWRRFATALACVAVFVTTYALMLPAVTMTVSDADTICGKQAHMHGAECYDAEGNLICPLEQHEHDMSCFAVLTPILDTTCGYAYEHAHGEDCYVDGLLVCTLTEHVHTEECYPEGETEVASEPETALTVLTASVEAELEAVDVDGAGDGLVAYEEKSIMTDSFLSSLGISDANAWQVVSGGYTGNAVANKTDVASSNYIRAQKNVIPTGTENEFLIYLSVDLNFESLFQSVVMGNDTAIVILSSASINTNGSVKQPEHCENAWAGTATNARPLYSSSKTGYDQPWTVSIIYTDSNGNKATKIMTRYSTSKSFNNGQVGMKLGDTWYVVGEAKKGSSNSSIDITLEPAMVSRVLSHLNEVTIGTLEDSMGTTVGGQAVGTGEGIIATEIVASAVNGVSANNATIAADGKSIDWQPTASSLGSTSSGWYNNVAELVYRIKFVPPKSTGTDVTSGDVLSTATAQCPTNGTTKIAYTMTNSSGNKETGELSITSPVVTGLLYELKATKTDEGGTPLEGAEFELYTKSGANTTVVQTVSSDSSGIVDFTGLTCGTYYLREKTAPDGYVKDDTEYGPYVLCYTTDKASLKGQGSLEEALYNPTTPITIMNKEAPGFELPSTGGVGIYPFLAAGIVLIAVPVIVFCKNKKKY